MSIPLFNVEVVGDKIVITVISGEVEVRLPPKQEEIQWEYNESGEKLASGKQRFVLEKLGLWKEGTTAQEAWMIIKEEKEKTVAKQGTEKPVSSGVTVNGKGEPLPWEKT